MWWHNKPERETLANRGPSAASSRIRAQMCMYVLLLWGMCLHFPNTCAFEELIYTLPQVVPQLFQGLEPARVSFLIRENVCSDASAVVVVKGRESRTCAKFPPTRCVYFRFPINAPWFECLYCSIVRILLYYSTISLFLYSSFIVLVYDSMVFESSLSCYYIVPWFQYFGLPSCPITRLLLSIILLDHSIHL